jgi:hypothetical protein
MGPGVVGVAVGGDDLGVLLALDADGGRAGEGVDAAGTDGGCRLRPDAGAPGLEDMPGYRAARTSYLFALKILAAQD